MKAPLFAVTLLALALPAAMVAQDDIYGYKVNYAANLHLVDSALDFTNSGATGGTICANLYVFSPDEELQTCCSCSISPNAIYSAAVIGPKPDGTAGLLNNTATLGNNYLAHFHSAVIKVLATAGACTSNNAGNLADDAALAPGLLAWGSHGHILPNGSITLTETPFASATLSGAERTRTITACRFFLQNLSGAGICAGCGPAGGLVQTSSLTPKLGGTN